MKEKVLVLASVASMIEQFNMPNIKLLIDMGYTVEVACNFIDGGTIPSDKVKQLQENLDTLGVKYYQIDFNRNPLKLNDTFKAYKQVKRLIDNENYKFVHCHSPIGGVVTRLACKKSDTKVIYTAHGFHFYKGAPLINWMIYYPIEKYLSNYTDLLITINNEDYERAKSKFNADKLVHIKGVGVNLEKFKPIDLEKKISLKMKYGFIESDLLLIYVGELSKRKNQIFLLENLKTVFQKNPNVKLLLVGSGPLMSKYGTYVKKHKLENNVKLLGYRSDIKELMQISDLCISSSKQEGLPVNLMEAMAVGLPIIASNSRGNKDLVLKNENGYIFELENDELFGDTLLALIYNRDLINEMSKMSSKLSEDYDLDEVMKDYKLKYKEM